MKSHKKPTLSFVLSVMERLQWVSPGTHFRAWEKVDSTRAGRRWW